MIDENEFREALQRSETAAHFTWEDFDDRPCNVLTLIDRVGEAVSFSWRQPSRGEHLPVMTGTVRLLPGLGSPQHFVIV